MAMDCFYIDLECDITDDKTVLFEIARRQLLVITVSKTTSLGAQWLYYLYIYVYFNLTYQ